MDDWPTFSHPDWRLDWRYPSVTPQGQAVQVQTEAGRAHLTSPGSAEVYFEVRRLTGVAAEAAYVRHQAELKERFAGQHFSITALAPGQAAGRAAQSYSFNWNDQARTALLLPLNDELYRIIYDPRSALNAEILATVTVRA